ncbi:MAG: DUF262 domain-containing protein [Synergistaceae bacterium]
MSAEMHVNGTYILDTFNDYLEGNYYVNRKYQRKLVWTLEEKQAFIDTILHQYPVPIFLIAKYKMLPEEFYRKDIIDGLQRFNAIFSFIKNEFPVKFKDGSYYYFNTAALAGSEEMINSGILTQNDNRLDYQTSRKFLNYQLPVTTTEVDDTEVEEIFRRINSTGRKLSTQDLRQAGAVGLFSDLVRKTACYIRGDITENDLILLSEMPILSLSNNKLEYGIKVRETFWVKHDIITETNIRVSRDEEIIARIYGYMLLGNKASPTSQTLDSFYELNSSNNVALEKAIADVGILNLMDKFSKILADFNSIFESVNSNFSAIVFKTKVTGGKAKIFQAMFLALYELRENNKYINDFVAVAKSLSGIGDSECSEITNAREWSVTVRNNAIRRIKSILEPQMIKKIQSKGNSEWKLKLETQLLAASGSEQQMYDFKMGITDLDKGSRNKGCVSKIVKTLTSMANTQPNKEGVVIIGVADNLKAAKMHQSHYGSGWLEVNKCYVTGIDDELKKYWNNSVDKYTSYLEQVIAEEPVQDDVRSQILRNYEIIEYQGKTLIIMKCKNSGHSFTYDREFFEREGSSLKKVEIGSASFNELMTRTLQVERKSVTVSSLTAF